MGRRIFFPPVYMCAQQITFHWSVDCGSNDMDFKSTKNHGNVQWRGTYTGKSYAPSFECGWRRKQLQVLSPPRQVNIEISSNHKVLFKLTLISISTFSMVIVQKWRNYFYLTECESTLELKRNINHSNDLYSQRNNHSCQRAQLHIDFSSKHVEQSVEYLLLLSRFNVRKDTWKVFQALIDISLGRISKNV